MKLENAISSLNQRLKDSGGSPRVRQKGRQLYIRATLPKRPWEGLGTKRYELALGIPATQDGLKFAETKCHELTQELMMKTFSWASWERDRVPTLDELPISALVANFKDHYMRSTRNPPKETTWNNTWGATFNQLPQDAPLTEVIVLAAILSKDVNSCIRERTCQRLQSLCDYAGLKIDLKPYKGHYGQGSEEPRDIPSDDLIVEWRDRIPNAQWQWVYGMLSTFGLRPHEVFFCEFIDELTLKVVKGKTGYRITRAIHPHWVNDWDLTNEKRPIVSGQTMRDYGQRINRQFDRYKIPFLPYDLRHAYAIRGSVVAGMDESAMAQMMGHSPHVHHNIYHRWLSDAVVQKNYEDKILKKSS